MEKLALIFLYNFHREHNLLKIVIKKLSPKINVKNIKKTEFSSFKSSAIAKSELHVYDETPNLVNFVLLSLTELYLMQIMQVSC